MLKINFKKTSSAPLNEVTTRYLRERFKLPEQFAEWISTTFRENGDALVEVFIYLESVYGHEFSTYDFEKLKGMFNTWLTYGGKTLDDVLKRYPAKKKELVDLSKQNYIFFLNKIQTLAHIAKIPKQLERMIKQAYRDNYEALITIFCARYKAETIDYISKWNFFNTIQTNPAMIDSVLKKNPSQKDELIRLAIEDYFLFQTEIEYLNDNTDKEEVILKLPNKYQWVNLHTTYCSKEAKRMGHCGMAGAGGTLFSLRQVLDSGEDEPAVTIEMNEKTKDVHQIKGGYNNFPQEALWPYIYEFFKHFRIEKDNIRERLAEVNDEFMSYFSEETKQTLEDRIKYLRELAISTKEEPNGWNRFANKFGAFMTYNTDLTIDQFIEVFEIYFFEYYKGLSGEAAIKNFFSQYEPKADMDFNLQLVSKITDLLEERGAFSDPRTSTALIVDVLISNFKILEYFKSKIKDQSEATSAFQNLPIFKRLMSILEDANKKEKEKEEKFKMREHRRNLTRVKFKMDHRGYFKL